LRQALGLEYFAGDVNFEYDLNSKETFRELLQLDFEGKFKPDSDQDKMRAASALIKVGLSE
jgi:hypothetical protein